MAKRKRPPSCRGGDRRFTVVVVGNDPNDSHAARSFEKAMASAQPDRGDRVTVYRTCAKSEAEARLPSNYRRKGAVVRAGRAKR